VRRHPGPGSLNPRPHCPPLHQYCRHDEARPERRRGWRGRAPGVHTPGPAPLQPIFVQQLFSQPNSDVTWWARPGLTLRWPATLVSLNTLFRKVHSCSSFAYFCPCFCILDNSWVQLETRHYHMYMCVFMFIPSFLVVCWW
jgi:hypothetical protein